MVSLKGQFQFSAEVVKNHYSEKGIFAKRRFLENHPSSSTYLQVFQTNLFNHKGTLSYQNKKYVLFAGIERSSITYNLQRFDGNGQLMRYFSFSTVSLGVGKSWLISKPDANKIIIGINAYGFKMLNKKGVEKNSQFFFSPSTNKYWSVRDKERESFTLRNGRNIGLGMSGDISCNPDLKNNRIMIFARLDYSLTPYFLFTWLWQEDGYPQPVHIGGDSYRRSLSIGLTYNFGNGEE
jgi:hypothetical protein